MEEQFGPQSSASVPSKHRFTQLKTLYCHIHEMTVAETVKHAVGLDPQAPQGQLSPFFSSLLMQRIGPSHYILTCTAIEKCFANDYLFHAGASRTAMAEARLPLQYRDTCAHLLIPLNQCRTREYYLPWKCEVRQLPSLNSSCRTFQAN